MANTDPDCLLETEENGNGELLLLPQPSTSGCTEQQFMDEFMQSIDFDCSLSSTDFNLSDLTFEPDDSFKDALNSCNIFNFNDVLDGIDHFLKSASAIDSLIHEQPLKEGIVANNDKNIECMEHKKKWSLMRKGQRYMPSFKRKVLNYAVKHTFKETAKKFSVNCNTLTEWAREYKRLLLLKKSTTTRPGSIQKTDKTISVVKTDIQNQDLSPSNMTSDAMFLQWLRNKRIDGSRITREEVRSIGVACLNQGGHPPPWFASWICRLAEGKVEESVQIKTRKAEKHIIYPVSFKIEVALYAREYTKCEAAKIFGVSSRRLYEWCERLDVPEIQSDAAKARSRVEEELLTWFNQRRATGARPKSLEIMEKARTLYAANGLANVKCSQGWLNKVRKRLDLKLLHSDDEELLLWILSQLDNNISLTVLQVTTKACELAARNNVTTFKGSKGWTLRFLKRHSHLLQCSSVMLSDLPVNAAAQAQSFCLAVQQRVGDAGLLSASFGCMDEVPVTFIYPSEKVPTPPLLRKVGLEEAHVVILLAATSDGRLLPPAVVLKGSRAVQIYNVDDIAIPVLYHETGSVDVNTLQQWLRLVWFRHVAGPSLLVVDSFAPHLDGSLAQELLADCCHIAVIPPGCAVHLQPCGFNLSRRFKECVQDEWLKIATSSNTNVCRPKSGPDEEAILKWVVAAYETLREDTYSIKSSFHLTGLTKPNCVEELNLPHDLSSVVHNKD